MYLTFKRQLPTIVGKMVRGVSSPAKPTLLKWEPLSITKAAFFSSLMLMVCCESWSLTVCNNNQEDKSHS